MPTDSPPPAPRPPLDLQILREQTGADRNLEREVLILFLRKSAVDLETIAVTTFEARRRAAHSLLGSARAVGAQRVCQAAEAVERSADGTSSGIEELKRALSEAAAFIKGHLAQSA